MRKEKFKNPPSIYQHTRDSILEELQSWFGLITADWKWIITVIIGVLILLGFTEPLPPAEVYLAVGQHGSSFDKLGQRFIPYFAEEGIRLNLVYTSGSAESLAELANKDIQVNAALLVGGISKRDAYPNLASLGSIEYAPLWLFYRGSEYKGKEGFTYFSNMRTAIGREGSGTQILLRKLLELRGFSLDNQINFLKLPHQEALQKLLNGEIDAMCILDGMDSPTVQQLLGQNDINIYSFQYAPAYEKKLPFLDTVVIPKGSLDLKTLRPDQDVQMLASTVTLLVESDMHPAIQQLFLLATKKISAEANQFFAKPDFFPAYVDHTIKLSPIAQRYYDHGPPPLDGVLPHWLTSYLDRVWLLVVGGFAIIYPLFNIFPSYRRIHSTMLISDAYEDIQKIENLAVQAHTAAELKSLVDQLDKIDADTRESWISSDEINKLYTMKSALNLIRQQIIHQINDFDSLDHETPP